MSKLQPSMAVIRRGRALLLGLLVAVPAIVLANPTLASATASHPRFAAHAPDLRGGHTVTLRLLAPSASHCALVETGPRHLRVSHTYGAGGRELDLTVIASNGTATGRWHFAVSCRSSSQRSLGSASTSITVAGTHGHRALVGVESSRWPDGTTPQIRTVSGAGFGGGQLPNPFELGQCTYWAFEMRPEVYLDSVNNGAPKGGWNGGAWKNLAKYGNFPEGTTPQAGALLSYGPGTNSQPGHVAYVTTVFDANHFATTEMNTDASNAVTNHVWTRYYYFGAPDSHEKSYTYVRKLLPSDGAVFIYEKTTAPPATSQPTPIQGGAPVTIQGGGSGSGSGASTPPPTRNETPGGSTHTWTNYSNAGGSPGPTISTGQTIQVSCRLTGFQVADGNNWWYRISSSPWNNIYYASADAFYNNGATSGSLHGTPFVDTAVPTC